MSQEHCTQCPNACPRDNLSCPKGRKFYGLPVIPEGAKRESLVDKFIRCGKKADSINQEMIDYGMDGDMVIQALTAEQQADLYGLLELLEARWKSDFGR